MSGIYFNPFDGKFIALPQKIGKSDSPTFAGMEVTGDLIVSGNTVTVTDLTVSDKTITVAFGAPTGAEADGGGFIIDGANIEFLYNHAETAMTLNSDLLPAANATFNIGSDAYQWNDATFSGTVKSSAFDTQDISVTSGSLATTTVSETVLVSVDAVTVRSGKFVIQGVSGSESQVTEVLVTHDGISAASTEYAIVFTGLNKLFDVRADVDAGNLRLLVTSSTANSTTYRVMQSLLLE
jgi:hypothetical protein